MLRLGNLLETNEEVKFIAIVLDSILNCQCHIAQILIKLTFI